MKKSNAELVLEVIAEHFTTAERSGNSNQVLVTKDPFIVQYTNERVVRIVHEGQSTFVVTMKNGVETSHPLSEVDVNDIDVYEMLPRSARGEWNASHVE